MSCICQFYAPGEDTNRDLVTVPLPTSDDISSSQNPTADADESLESTALKTGVSASDLSDCRAENWILTKKLREYEVTIENLEQLVTTIVEKQHQILTEMFHLRKENRELQSECHLQREYHSMERNALMRELHDAQTRRFLLGCRSNESKGSLSCTPTEPPIKSASSNEDCDETETSESEDEDLGKDGSDASSDEEDQDSAPSSGQNSGSTSPSLTDLSCDTDSDDNRSSDYRSRRDSPLSDSDTD
ncbi:suppressor protein SRP40 [Drosophila eugracilis]|uniref:suppressor protein SRP40 n=1 Tax=Drosophila eugracilis TaxID=29029 RepID=UPI001BDA1511|nr:suppressor protein SRP40 [Drosophila eugracilis]